VYQLLNDDFDGLSNKSFTIYTDSMSASQIQSVLTKINSFVNNGTKVTIAGDLK
jgi:hypothetical protein